MSGIGGRVARYAQRHWVLISVAFVLVPLMVVAELAQPYLIKVAIDEHVMKSRFDGLIEIGLLYVAMVFTTSVLDFLRQYALEIAGRRTAFDLQVDFHKKLLEMPASFFDQNKAGNLLTRITSDTESVALLFSSGAVMLAADALRLVGVVIMVLVVEPEFGLVMLALVPVLVSSAEISRRRFRDAWRELRDRAADMNGYVHEHLGGLRVVQAFGVERRVVGDLRNQHLDYAPHFMKEVNTGSALMAGIDLLGYLAIAVVIWLSVEELASGAAALGGFVAFIAYIQKFLEPVRALASKFSYIATTAAGAARVFTVLDRSERDAPVAGAAPLLLDSGAAPAVAFENVCFRYGPGDNLFDGLDLTIEKDQVIAVVGPTGSGKSTLAKLISRFYEPQAGRILLFGRDVRTIPPAELRRRVACVPQDVVLFSGTVAENIACFSPYPMEEIERVARMVGLDGVLERRKESLNTPVTERGANFSAGERQLIALARGLLHQPEILILDEATASIDPELERMLEKRLSEILVGRTTLIIAHRLATVRRADRIVILEHGQIESQGDHRELLERDGRYARLFELQTSGQTSAR